MDLSIQTQKSPPAPQALRAWGAGGLDAGVFCRVYQKPNYRPISTDLADTSSKKSPREYLPRADTWATRQGSPERGGKSGRAAVLRAVRSQRGAGGGKGMGPGAGGEWLRPRRRWCSGRRGRRRWQWGRRRGSWRRRRGEGGGREAGGWAPPHTLVVSVGSLGGMGQGAGGGGGGDCGGGGGDDEGGGSGGDGGDGGGRRRPIVEQ